MASSNYTEWKIESIIALVIAFSFIASSTYLFGFFSEINIEISAIPINISDILISYYHWVLPTFYLLVTIQILKKLSGMYDNNLPEQDIIRNAKRPRIRQFQIQFFFYVLFFGSIIKVILWISIGIKQKEDIYGLGLALGFLVIILNAKVNKLKYEKSRFYDLLEYPQILFIFLLAISITKGCADGFQFINNDCKQVDSKQENTSFISVLFDKNIYEVVIPPKNN